MPSYEQSQASKLWSVRFREIDNTGESHQKRLSGYRTKKEAQRGYQDYLTQKTEEEKRKKTVEQTNNISFDGLAEEFFKFKKSRVKYATYYAVQSRATSKILPYFSGKKAREITPLDILNWQDTIKDLSYNYQIKLFHALSGIYKYAEKYHKIPNVMKDIDRPRNTSRKKEMQIWTPEEFGQFYATIDKSVYQLYFLTLYTTGMRRGECEALTWADFSPSSSKIRINKSVTNKTQQKGWEITTPKNDGSIRTLTIPPFLCDMLNEYHQDRLEATYIFGDTRPLAQTSTDRYFKRIIAQAQLKPIRIHDLRHSCASLLISRGVSIVGVSHQLGHVDVEQTLNTYSHLMPDDNSKIIAELQTVSAFI